MKTTELNELEQLKTNGGSSPDETEYKGNIADPTILESGGMPDPRNDGGPYTPPAGGDNLPPQYCV